jgi:hypothetical protein
MAYLVYSALVKPLASMSEQDQTDWLAPGPADTELGALMEPEVSHGEAEVYTRVQA